MTKTEHRKFRKILRMGRRETVGAMQPGDYIAVYEKLDGANASFIADDGNVRAFSRNLELSVDNTLRGFLDFALKQDASKLRANYRYFGEWLVPHKVDYGEHSGDFYLFDVYNEDTTKYEPIDVVVAEAFRLGLKIAPILYLGNFKDYAHLESLIGRSAYAKVGGDNGEGIVVKNLTREAPYLKLVSESFREVSNARPPKDPADLIAERAFVDATVNEARVDKHLRKLIDEGLAPEFPTLQDMGVILKNLGRNITEDILEEEGDQLPEGVDIAVVTKSVGKVAPKLLRQIIEQDELSRFQEAI